MSDQNYAIKKLEADLHHLINEEARRKQVIAQAEHVINDERNKLAEDQAHIRQLQDAIAQLQGLVGKPLENAPAISPMNVTISSDGVSITQAVNPPVVATTGYMNPAI